jgi:hypothetical protein
MERWLPIPEYEDIYSVSDLGRVRIEVKRHNIRRGAMLTQTPQRDGYLQVALSRGLPEYRRLVVGRLVLFAFEGLPPEEGMQANHKNGDISDNRLENLEWVTPKENIQHSMRVLGHGRAGEKNPAAKLTEEDVRALRKRAAAGETYTSLGRAFDVTNVMARMIATGKAWTHVRGPLQGKRPVGRPPTSKR